MKLKTFLWSAAIFFSLALFTLNLNFGELNQDEGWYLYGARLVSEGQVPYRDFAFSQGPVMAYTYALAAPLVKAQGLLGGRLFTIFLAVLALAIAAFTAYRISPKPLREIGALLVVLLIGINAFQSYFSTVVKTYALSGLWTAAGFLCLALLSKDKNRIWVNAFLALAAALVMALAVGTRLSALFAIPFAFFYLAINRKTFSWFPALLFAAGTGVFFIAIFYPFYRMAPESFRFWMVEYHASRLGGSPLNKASFVSYAVGAYLPALVLITLSLAAWFMASKKSFLGHIFHFLNRDFSVKEKFLACLWLAIFFVTAVHFSAPFPYADYQAFIFPVFAVAAASTSLRMLEKLSSSARWLASSFLPLAIFLFAMAHSFSSPLNQNWFLGKRELIWWKTRPHSPIAQLRTTAKECKALAGSEPGILTQDLYLAVETQLRVPEGMAMGTFSYYPSWTRERAETCHVVNREMLLERIQKATARVAALSEYGFAIASPTVEPVAPKIREEILALIQEKYRFVRSEEVFGQGNTRLDLYQKK